MNDSPIQEWRKQRPHDLLTEHFGGNKSALGQALGYQDGAFVRQLLLGTRPITEKTLRKFDDRKAGPPGWFDQPAAGHAADHRVDYHGGAPTPVAAYRTQDEPLAYFDSDPEETPDPGQPRIKPGDVRLKLAESIERTRAVENALEVVGMAIAATPAELRKQLGDEMRIWAEYGGKESHRQAVQTTLTPRKTKVDAA